MFKTFQYRLYPSKLQRETLEATVETCRNFYNALLAERKDAYARDRRSVSRTEQYRHVKHVKATCPEAQGIHSHILQVVVADLALTFDHFFRRAQAGEKAGAPRFKARFRFHSFGLKEYGNGFKIDGRRLKVSGIGRLAVRWHRPLEGEIKTLRIARKADGWYACFRCQTEAQPLPPTGEVVGVDLGVSALLTTSTGEKTKNPRWYRTAQRKLRVCQRRIARRKLGGKNRRKAVRRLQRVQQHVQNGRRNFFHQLARRLTARYDVIVVEALQISNLVQNRRLSKSILDAGWGLFISLLTNKAEEAGRVVERVNPAYTSKTCSGCGFVFEHLTLRDRWIACGCGLSLDRDHNAAINILKRSRVGQTLSTLSLPEGGLVEEAAPPGRVRSVTKPYSPDSLVATVNEVLAEAAA